MFNGGANDFYDASIPASNLVWIVNFINAGATNTVLGPLSGIANGTFSIPADGPSATNGCYQFVLTATDSAGHSATNFTEIFPSAAAAPSNRASFYPFTSGAQDASNLYNGALQGGASIFDDPVRGDVLNLSGSGWCRHLAGGGGLRSNHFGLGSEWTGRR